MAIHKLKTNNELMPDIKSRTKTFEVRFNDRDYKVSDTLILKGWNVASECFTGQEIKVHVTYILQGNQYGIKKGYVMMGIQVLNCNY